MTSLAGASAWALIGIAAWGGTAPHRPLPQDEFVELGTAELAALDQEGRNEYRKRHEAWLHGLARDGYGEGWEELEVGRILVFTQGSKGRAKELATQLQAAQDWLDETFPDVGSERYLRAPILVVYRDENWSERQRDVPWSDLVAITFNGQTGGAMSQGLDLASRCGLFLWFRDRDAMLWSSLPKWLDSGLNDLVADSRNKRGKLTFREDEADQKALDDARRAERLAPIRRLLTYREEAFRRDPAARAQAGRLIEFLADKKAKRHKLFKHVLTDYMRHLGEVQLEIDLDFDKAAAAGKTLEDANLAAPETRLLEETFARTFAAWGEDDWADLEKAFQKAID